MKRVISILLALVSIIFFNNEGAVSSVKVGDKAPEFTLPSAAGDEVKLADYSGKFVVLEWVNYQCPFVKKHYVNGDMQKLQREFTEKGVIWLSICSSAPGKQGHFPREKVAEEVSRQKAVPTAYLIDEEGTVGRAYGAKTTPHLFIISPEGKVIYAGAIDSIRSVDPQDVPKATNYVREALQAALEGKEVKIPSTTPYGCSVKYAN
ncbi:MAG: thioredoxin family protein [Methylacidiphilales bacterium]|nr:thioredoxin family protein [Candidatus Methylacidiphilales bacterium]MDW8350176.1 thioredoxin family protein [Verrucomicrobiae bacterium]